jgi:hypothetical protein
MESEVGHTYVISIWIDQANPDPSFPGLSDGSLLLGEEVGYFGVEFFGHDEIIARFDGELKLLLYIKRQRALAMSECPSLWRVLGGIY